MDYNTHSAQQLHRQRSAELARITELRRRSAERESLVERTTAPISTAPAGWWHRIRVRWHIAPRPVH